MLFEIKNQRKINWTRNISSSGSLYWKFLRDKRKNESIDFSTTEIVIGKYDERKFNRLFEERYYFHEERFKNLTTINSTLNTLNLTNARCAAQKRNYKSAVMHETCQICPAALHGCIEFFNENVKTFLCI